MAWNDTAMIGHRIMRFTRTACTGSRRTFLAAAWLGVTLGTGLPHTAQAQDGSYDPSFANGGRRLVDLAPGQERGYSVEVLADRSVAIHGACRHEPAPGVFRFSPCAARLNVDGSDTTWGEAGSGSTLLASLTGSTETCFAARTAWDTDGRLALGLRCDTAAADDLVLLNVQGDQVEHAVALQTRFEGLPARAYSMRRDALGRYLLLSLQTGPGALFSARLDRFDATLNPDPSYGDAGSWLYTEADVFLWGREFAVDPEGRAVVYTERSTPAAQALGWFLVRADADGLLDAGWGNGGLAVLPPGAQMTVFGLTADAASRIIVVGYRFDADDGDYDLAVARFTADGALDFTFAANGLAIIEMEGLVGFGEFESGVSATALADGSIVIAGGIERPGNPSASYFLVAHLDADGALVPGFGISGVNYGTFEQAPGLGLSDFAADIALDPAGFVVLGGTGRATGGGANDDLGVARLHLAQATVDAIFADGLED